MLNCGSLPTSYARTRHSTANCALKKLMTLRVGFYSTDSRVVTWSIGAVAMTTCYCARAGGR
jgi:hypothetical protein